MLAERIDEWNRTLREESLEEGLQKGLQEGLQRGLQKGLQKGEANALLRLLERRFGPLDPPTRERIAAADSDRLLDWIDRAATATSLADVLSD